MKNKTHSNNKSNNKKRHYSNYNNHVAISKDDNNLFAARVILEKSHTIPPQLQPALPTPPLPPPLLIASSLSQRHPILRPAFAGAIATEKTTTTVTTAATENSTTAAKPITVGAAATATATATITGRPTVAITATATTTVTTAATENSTTAAKPITVGAAATETATATATITGRPTVAITATATTTAINIPVESHSNKIKFEIMEPYWSEANGAPHSVKYESEAAVSSFPYCTESSLNFSTSATAYSEDDAEFATGRRNKTSRQDPLSHRIIEKRRRDRMNSCLADLSRLIPPQYQRKGRGRIEKTEIIEMAIRHLKHLQNECMQKDNDYRQGYTDCMKEAAKFLYDSQMQDFCYRLLTRLQEHCDEVMKNDCYKSRACHATDSVSASSGSPHQPYHPTPTLCQLRDMLGTSDIEHSSNDHNDVKDLSFRNHLNQLQRVNGSNGNGIDNNADHNNIGNNSTSSTTITSNNNNPTSSTSTNKMITTSMPSSTQQQPHQAPVITSTAPANLHHHTDSSNHDFDSSREPILHAETSNMPSPPPQILVPHHNHHLAHLNHNHHTSDSLSLGRLRNFSESSHDIEHNNNYKYKNHIKERFNHELHDEETSSEHCPVLPMLQSEHSHTHSMSEHSKDGTEPEIAPIIAKKRKLAEAASNGIMNGGSNIVIDENDTTVRRTSISTANVIGRDEKPLSFNDIKTELYATNNSLIHGKVQPSSTTSTALPATPHTTRSFAVPIFALHGQGTYYVPLNVDYNVLLPFLNGIDLLEKNYTTMPVVHPININVNFMPPTPSASLLAAAAAAAAVAAGKQQMPPIVNSNAAVAAAAVAKAKLEAITNGW